MVDKSNFVFSFDLLQSFYDSEISKKEDVLIVCVHSYLVKTGADCFGLGDNQTYDTSEKGSKLLPEGWNKRPNYVLRYAKDKKLYILYGTRSDDDLLINLLRVEDQNVSNVQFPINQTVQNLHGSLDSVIPSYQNVLQTIGTDLIEPILPSNTRESSVQTTANEDKNDSTQSTSKPQTVPLRVQPPSSTPLAARTWYPNADPSNIGAADLDPFARGGGMIYDPFLPDRRNHFDPLRPGIGMGERLPPRAVPPQARFYPFGPPDIDPMRTSGSSHLPFPGSDNSFL
ncbi:proteasome inhibitor PI31 subunit [Colletes gigas]|uniref:proteasome inhibitor PI31 subunit n=1 Tax=Colletes gigas TaxID=935657 RepID=UPI001C9A342E|nr:proteasome inhibitor PI31 subunit [Colletes gigas]